MAERIQKILARAGVASRRGAEEVIEHGRVTVNGETVRVLGSRADAALDDIRVDGVRVRLPARHTYLLLNKPKGIVTTRRDPAKRQTVMDLVPSVVGLFPVGRLDVNTEGLLLLTNDGDFAERVAHPRHAVPRVYRAKVRGLPTAATLRRLARGVNCEGERLATDDVRVVERGANPWLELTIHQGRTHEVRRLLRAVGHPVSKLKRVAIGSLTARGLAVGQCRMLSDQERRRLLGGGRSRRENKPARDRRAQRSSKR